MNYKKRILKHLRLMCLRCKLKSLERSRISFIQNYILSNPSQASKTDNIEKMIVSDKFERIIIDIKLIKKIIKKIKNKNPD